MVRPKVNGSVKLPLDRIQTEFTAPGPEMRRLITPFSRLSMKSSDPDLDTDSAGFASDEWSGFSAGAGESSGSGGELGLGGDQ